MAMREKSEQQDKRGSDGARPVSPDPILHEEAAVDPLKVKKPEGNAKPKNAHSRERRKRNVGPFE